GTLDERTEEIWIGTFDAGNRAGGELKAQVFAAGSLRLHSLVGVALPLLQGVVDPGRRLLEDDAEGQFFFHCEFIKLVVFRNELQFPQGSSPWFQGTEMSWSGSRRP